MGLGGEGRYSMSMSMSNGKRTTHAAMSDRKEPGNNITVPLSSMNMKYVQVPSKLLTLHQRQGVEFVYPRGSAHPSRPIAFVFKKSSKQPVDEEVFTSDGNLGREGHHQQESLDEILGGKKATINDASDLAGGGEESSRAGKLSGVSVEDALKDKTGCRPRANSTDGELNLPRRGLCDEGMVLKSHKWEDWRQRAAKGFVNLGNTCFLNATLQCLAYLPPFCQCLTSLDLPAGKLSQGQRITDHLRRLFRQVHDLDPTSKNVSAGGAIAPLQVVKAVPTLGSICSRNGHKFRPGRQEDAHEFLVHLLDAMQDGELRAAGINQHVRGWRDRLPIPRLDETTFIHRVFGGYLRSQVRCTKCGFLSNTYDPFLDLALEVSKKSSSSIASAFQEFSRKETLDKNNRWRCSSCRKDVCATKQLTVFRPPLSLCIQLKRFTFLNGQSSRNFSGYPNGIRFMGTGGGSKINKAMDFPAQLKVPLSDGRKCEYALTGIVVHLGNSATSGHYTAFVRKPGHEGSLKWFHMDDSFVETVSENHVLKQKGAYVLFYCRTEVKLELPSPPLRASMTTEEAKDLNTMRTKSRVRSSSFSNESPSPAITMQLPRKMTSSSHDKVDKVTIPVDGSGSEEKCIAKKALMKEDGSMIGRLKDTTSHLAKKTRVDRVTAFGKLEVMIGPRCKATKAWKPKIHGTVCLSDADLELLGSKRIARWGDDDGAGATTSNRRAALEEIEKESRILKRTMQLDRWDSVLDQGKVKKVKTDKGPPSTAARETTPNPFQRIQTGLQSMNRKRLQWKGTKYANGVHLRGKTKHSLSKSDRS